MLFGKALPISYPSNKSSFVLKETSNTDETTQTAIGQGETLVTPMHMAMITSAIANKGVSQPPR